MTVFDLDRGREVLAFARIGRIRNAVLTLSAVRDHRGELFPGEATYAATVADKRGREYSTGRRMAREGLKRIGVEPCEIPSEDRRPVWPEGVVGSIGHSRGLAAAIVGPADAFDGLGIDHRDRERRIGEHGRSAADGGRSTPGSRRRSGAR